MLIRSINLRKLSSNLKTVEVKDYNKRCEEFKDHYSTGLTGIGMSGHRLPEEYFFQTVLKLKLSGTSRAC